MKLPTSDAQSPRFLPDHHHSTLAPNSSAYPAPPSMLSSSVPLSGAGLSGEIAHDRTTDFAASSWDLATGGLKALTAKRELPPRLDRRPSERLLETTPAPYSYTFTLVILACIVVMLISGGVVLFMIIQP